MESFLTKRYDDEETQQDIKALQELVYLFFIYVHIFCSFLIYLLLIKKEVC